MQPSRCVVAVIVAVTLLNLGLYDTCVAQIDRQSVVSRHTIVVRAINPNGAMAVGNGEIAFNVDVTGLQSFPDYYSGTMPLGILSTWGWHNFPNPEGYTLDKFKFTTIKKFDREFTFPSSATSNPPPEPGYLRANPHRLGLGRIGLEMTKADGSKVAIEDLKNIEQRLNIWDGVMTSSFEVDGVPVRVTTAAHPTRDELATRVESALIRSGRLKIAIAYPYGIGTFGPEYQDWTKPEAHQTVMTRRGDTGADFARTLDSTNYNVRMKWSPGVNIAETAKHHYLLSANTDRIELTSWFSPKAFDGEADGVDAVVNASRDGWKSYWMKGGIIDLSGNEDPRALELERRIVQSQYVMRVHCGGSQPGAETGLAANSWFGKFHTEMYWFHAAHWGYWGHIDLLEKSLKSLKPMMEPGRKMAVLQKSRGVKWSKMTDPTGIESPSGIGPALVWQQPHPIYLAELVYRGKKDRATLEEYKDIVFETADYMATFVDFDPATKRYVLGPGISSADEGRPNYQLNTNPAMELGYWKWTLKVAQQWRERLGMPRHAEWDKVINELATPPIRNNFYVTLETPEETTASWMATWLYGPMAADPIDLNVMRNTLISATRQRVTQPQPAITWGFGMQAMCAARIGEPEIAVSLLVPQVAEGAEHFRVQGYSVRRPEQTPMYMPANGAWLSAAAIMAAGWDGNTKPNPGFPANWKVKHEGILPVP